MSRYVPFSPPWPHNTTSADLNPFPPYLPVFTLPLCLLWSLSDTLHAPLLLLCRCLPLHATSCLRLPAPPLLPATPRRCHCCHYDLAARQIRRTANAAFEASTPPRRNREHGHRSRGRSRSRSPPRPESSRKRRRSRSPKYDRDSPSDRLEKRARDAPQRARRDKLEFFRSGAGPRGGVCAVCLGRHEHIFSRCEGARLWDGSDGAARKNEQGRLVAADGLPLCFDWQMPKGCASASHPDRHRCSGCGAGNHGAQDCPRAQKA